MAKRLDKHKARLDALNAFGKDLARRSGSCCELCAASGVKLAIYETPPAPAEPEFDRCIFICETCHEQLENPKRVQSDHWRCLNTPVWSTVPAVQVTAVRMLRQLIPQASWAEELNEILYLSDDIEAKIKEV